MTGFMDYEICEPLRVWDRLEPRSRKVDFDDALAAKVHDPMWMLSRQWQIGEFQGEDTGSAVLAKLARRLTPMGAHQLGPGAGAPIEVEDGTLPAEARIERLPIDFAPIVRAQIGRTFLLHAQEANAAASPPPGVPLDPAALRAALLPDFAIAPDPVPEDDDLSGQATARGHARAGRTTAALAGRAIDGVALFEALAAEPPGTLPVGVTARTAPEHAPILLDASERFCAWFRELYPPPAGAGAWDPPALEYAGAASFATTAGDLQLTLREHVSGDLDWWAYDQGSEKDPPPGSPRTTTIDVRSVIPAPATFAGMPNPRWWQFEDAAVDLGHFRAQATDLARIVVAEFALVYGNNWFVIPVDQPVGTLAEIEGVVVTDVFGVRTLVGPAVNGSTGSWSSWDLFSVSPREASGAAVLGQHLLLPPTLSHAIDAEPHEVVSLVRDEVANLVWGVERRTADGLGGGEDGIEAARRRAAALDAILTSREEAAPLAEPGAPPAVSATPSTTTTEPPPEIRYRLGTDVSEAWIPFVPVHVPGQSRAIQLQRGAMPRFVDPNDDPELVRPRTSILRQGIDEATGVPTVASYVHEEEVPRAGVTVTGRLRRTRWFGGRTVIWHSRTVGPGRGEVDAGLRFDVVEPAPRE